LRVHANGSQLNGGGGVLGEGGNLSESLRVHAAELEAYAAGILRDASLAQDLMQTIWIRLDGVDATTVRSPRAFLFRMVRNAAIDWRRARMREGPTEEVAPDLVSPHPSPEQQLADRQRLARVLAVMEQLPERTRQALLMHRIEGLKLREIAERLSISIALAHALVREGVAACAEGLSHDD
jgi:RNA polymerase sigma-70 factor (ECF subfamily)